MIVTSTFNVHLSLPNVDEILGEPEYKRKLMIYKWAKFFPRLISLKGYYQWIKVIPILATKQTNFREMIKKKEICLVVQVGNTRFALIKNQKHN